MKTPIQAKPGTVIKIDVDEGWTCHCGAEQIPSVWVAAHWHERLTHTCNGCGTKRALFRGVLTTPTQTVPRP